MKQVVFTSCDLNYLDRAVFLARTIKRYNPELDFYLMLSDNCSKSFFEDPFFACFDCVIDTEDIGIPDFRNWAFGYDVIEMCTAVKGFCLSYLLSAGFDQVIYLDPDIACFSSLSFLFDFLNSSSIILTPHRLKPATSAEDFFDNEMSTFRYGIYNLGFLGVNSSAEAFAFVQWWSNRLRDYCLDDIKNGIFTDQKWCDAVPAFFPSSKVIHHPGCNVASWNLAERKVSIEDEKIFVNNSFPLVFYHFTKFFSHGSDMTLRYSSGLDSIAIWNWYGDNIRRVRDKIPQASRSGKYLYYYDGQIISRNDRAEYRRDPVLFKPDPFFGRIEN